MGIGNLFGLLGNNGSSGSRDLPRLSSKEREDLEKAILEGYAIRLFRSAWNLDLTQKAMVVASLSAGAAAASVGLTIWLATHPVPPKYFAVTPTGEVIPMQSLATPLLSVAQLLSLSQRWATEVYTWDYADWRQAFQQNSEHFDPDAWKQWVSSLKSGGLISATIKNKWVVSAVPTGAPVILASGILDGRATWRIQIPLLVTFASDTSAVQKHYIVTMVMQRAPTTAYPRGVRILQFIPIDRGVE